MKDMQNKSMIDGCGLALLTRDHLREVRDEEGDAIPDFMIRKIISRLDQEDPERPGSGR